MKLKVQVWSGNRETQQMDEGGISYPLTKCDRMNWTFKNVGAYGEHLDSVTGKYYGVIMSYGSEYITTLTPEELEAEITKAETMEHLSEN